MSSRTNITESDNGKKVVNADGNRIGIVSEVKNGSAYVDPDPSIMDTVRSKLGWDDDDKDMYELPSNSIDVVTDDEVRLNGNMQT